MRHEVDVVVVGAGPVGLLTAIELTVGGARVLVLERLPAASMVMKAGGIGPLGSEALQRRGMAAAIDSAEALTFAKIAELANQPGAPARGRSSRFTGHFAGLSLIRKEAQREPERRARAVDQQAVEAMLGNRARSLGVDVRRECEVTRFEQDVDGVDVDWVSTTVPSRIRCSYLVGCDGGRSVVRKTAGFDFPGTPPSSTLYQAVVDVDHPEYLMPIGWHRTSGGVFSYGPFPGRLFMLDFSGPPEHREAPVSREEVEAVLRRVSCKDVRVTALKTASRWTDHARLVNTYRQGRVLLAGDAAHVHSPFGGQGLALGLVDAANLGWKLATVVRGEMHEGLLETYTAERRPAAEAALANCLAQIAIMRPDPQAGAMRDLVANLMQLDDVNQRIGELMSGLAIRYELGSKGDDVGRLIGDRRVRHAGIEVSLYDVMQDGAGVFLDASRRREASKVIAGVSPRVRCVCVNKGPSMLVRPDACVSWVGEDDDIEGLEGALRDWFDSRPDLSSAVTRPGRFAQ